MSTPRIAYSYVRFSSARQEKGDSLRRQTAGAADWCKRNGVRLDTSRTWHDLGQSAYLGEHRANPDRHALAAFLRLVEEGGIPRGSYLIIESLDRLTREHVQAGLRLVLGLTEKGIKIVQLSPTECVYDDQADGMVLVMMLMELSRGHGESKRKSDLVGAAWKRKKDVARSEGRTATEMLPDWVQLVDGERVEIPERAEVVRTIFRLAGSGYGLMSVVQKLVRDNVKAWGRSGRWNKSYLGLILADRRATGEYQPKKGKANDGDPIPGYFPRVVTEEEFLAARAGAEQRDGRKGRGGRIGGTVVNLFSGLLRNAREGDTYQMTRKRNVSAGNVTHAQMLVNRNAMQGQGRGHSFPYLEFETAILKKLAEVDPAEIIGPDSTAGEVMILTGRRAGLVSRIAQFEAELAHGDVPSLARALRAMEAEKKDVDEKLADARQRAASPLANAWGEYRSLVDVLATAADQHDARLRLRGVLRRVVESMWLLVVKRGRERLAVCQVYFAGGGRREYVIYHRLPHAGFHGGRPAALEVESATKLVADLDLRNPDDARRLAVELETLSLEPFNR